MLQNHNSQVDGSAQASVSDLASVLLIHNGDGLSAQGISGGTLRSFEVIRRWATYKDLQVGAVTTAGGSRKLRDAGLTLDQAVLRASIWAHRERFLFYRIFSYVVSVLDFYRREHDVPPVDIAFSASDFFCDTAVARHLKRRRKNVMWVACVHHLYSSPWSRPGNPLANWGWFLLQRLSLRGIARHADLAFVYDTDEGDRAGELLARMGMPKERVQSMWNGVDLSRYRQTEAAEPEFDAVFVGEHRPNKGIFDIVPIWSEVKRQIPEARLRLVGYCPPEIRARLIRDIEQQDLGDSVIIAGEKKGEELVAAYRNARVFFMPSHEEGWGIAICEAMASGLPVAAYDLRAYARHYRSVLHIAPCFDRGAFARNVVRLLQDAEERTRSANAGRNLAAKYGWDEIARMDWDAIASRRGTCPAS